jgi:hypothetical protein
MSRSRKLRVMTSTTDYIEVIPIAIRPTAPKGLGRVFISKQADPAPSAPTVQSTTNCSIWPHRLSARTTPFQGVKTSSILVGAILRN